MDYTVLNHEAEEGGYWAEVPALDGCYGQGESVAETLEDIRLAIQSRIECLIEDGSQVPNDGTVRVARVTVSAPSAA